MKSWTLIKYVYNLQKIKLNQSSLFKTITFLYGLKVLSLNFPTYVNAS